MNEIYIYIPGILSLPGSITNWCGRAVTWTHTHSEHRAEKVEYLTGALTRPFRESKREKKLTGTMKFYIEQGWDLTLVGHSNGCDVILDSLKSQGFPKLKALHLISAACEADFDKNGLNKAPIGSITVWIATRDKALDLAGTFCGRLLGYGTLGQSGAKNSEVPVNYIRWPYRHNEWFKDENFDQTMERII